MLKTLLFLIFFASSRMTCEIIEAPHFHEIHPHLKPKTLLILDIDDTLLIPSQMLGSDEWFQTRLQAHKKEGCSGQQSLEKSLAEWEAVRHLTKMEIVESGIPANIIKIQDEGYVTMALTTQGLALATRTKQQLLGYTIDLKRSSPAQEDVYFTIDGHGILFRGGILFTAGFHKGQALFKLLHQLHYRPERIVFINDKRSHILEIEETAKQEGIEFIGLRYAYSDARKKAFDEKIADYQFTHSTFTHILSDEEACSAINKADSLKSPL
jgi:hypothetical protein